MDITSLGTPFGLAFASGLNAYLPLLACAISARWLHLVRLNPNFTFITSNWFITALALLTILDFFADKIPLIEHIWNAIHTVVRPFAGAIVAVAASGQAIPEMHITSFSSLYGSGIVLAALNAIPLTGMVLLVILLIGAGLAALSHTTKSTTRLLSTIVSAGFLNIGLSVIEDVLVIVFVLLSLFASAIMFILLVLILLILLPQFIRGRFFT